MDLLLAAVAVLIGSGSVAWYFQQWPNFSTRVAASGSVLAAVLGLIPVEQVLSNGQSTAMISRIWNVPFGHFVLGLDPLSAWFLVPILIIPALVSVYACDSLVSGPSNSGSGTAPFLLNLLTAAMIIVVLAQNGLLFLAAWEIVILAACGLILGKNDRPECQRAARRALNFAHLGSVFFWALLAFVGHRTNGALDFADFSAIVDLNQFDVNVVFSLALLGLGANMGLVPFHLGVIPAYSNAPAHVTAVLSGVTSTLGLYGLLRLISLLGSAPMWWNWTLIVVGLLTAFTGARRALSQRELKGFLAHLGLQTRGQLVLGLGLGLLALRQDQFPNLVSGLAGSLAHVWNHSLIVALLSLATGIVESQTSTSQIDQLGGQIRRMPWTIGAFLLGTASLCGLPPLNGFTSQFLIYWTASSSDFPHDSLAAIPFILVVVSLIFSSGISLLACSRVIGRAFLGAPLTVEAATATIKVGWRLRLPTLLLAIGCFATGLLATQIVQCLEPTLMLCTRQVNLLEGLSTKLLRLDVASALSPVVESLRSVRVATSVFSLTLIGLISLRWSLLARRPQATTGILGRTQAPSLSNLPSLASLSLNAKPVSREIDLPWLIPARKWSQQALVWLEQAPVNLRVLNVVLTLIALLIWQLRWSR